MRGEAEQSPRSKDRDLKGGSHKQGKESVGCREAGSKVLQPGNEAEPGLNPGSQPLHSS